MYRKLSSLKSTDESFRAVYETIFDGSNTVKIEYSSTLKTHRITYKEARERIELMARGLTAKIGSHNSYVGLWGDNSPMWPLAFWAILRSGNRPFLLNTRQPVSVSAELIKTLSAVAVVEVTPSPDFLLPKYSPTELTQLGDASPLALDESVFADEIALATTGTTENKKICIYRGVNITHQIYNTDAIVKENATMGQGYRGQLKHLVFLPLYHIFGLCAVYLWFCFFGATFVFPRSLSPDVLLHTIRRHDVTHIFAVPLFWHSIEKSVLRQVSARGEETQRKFETALSLSIKLSSVNRNIGQAFAKTAFEEIRHELFGDSVRFCISGGSYLRPSAQRLINALGYPLYNGYGMTEIGITSVELSRNIKTRLRSTIGKPFKSIEYKIGEDGHLYVKGKSRCAALIINGENTLLPEFFDTADIMERERDGRYVFTSRASELIIGESGENLNPDIIKQAYSLDGVSNFEIITTSSERPLLIVELRADTSEEEFSRICEECERATLSLPLSHRPCGVVYTYDSIMAEGEIKISRTRLSRVYLEGGIRPIEKIKAASVNLGNESDIKATVRALFSELLGVPPESIDEGANFMTELGGSSLDYYTLISELDKIYSITLPYESDGFKYSLCDFEKLIKEKLHG